MRRRPKAGRAVLLAASSLVALLCLGALLAPAIAPHPPQAIDLRSSFAPPSQDHPLGADKLGRDLLSRLLYGSRSTLLAALLVVASSTLLGTVLGLVSGYAGGLVDAMLSRIFDVLLAFPALLLALLIVASVGRGMANAVIALAVVYVPTIARLVRSLTLVESRLAYVEAAQALGYSSSRIVFVHIAPNVAPVVLVQSTIDFAYSILDLAALSFLGLGVQPPLADWGAMLAEGREYLLFAPSLAVAPGLAIMAAVIAFNLLGDGLQTRFDPGRRGA